MGAAEQRAVHLCDSAIDALGRLDSERLETLEAEAAASALELRALASLDGRRTLPELAARVRLLGTVVRATGENLRVLRGDPSGAQELPWVR